MSNTTTTTPIFRIFNGTERVSTAVVIGSGQMLQVKPSRKLFATQAEWMTDVMGTLNGALISMSREDKPKSKPWSEMTAEERLAYQKNYEERAHQRYEARQKAKAEKMIAMKADESKTIRAIRSVYDAYGIRNSLSMKATRIHRNPSVFVLSKGTLSPLYFNRKTGIALQGNENVLADFGDLETVSFYISTNKCTGAMKRVKPDLTIPSPNDKNILYLSNNNAITKADLEFVGKLTARGFKVKMVVMQLRSWFEYVREYKYDPACYEIIRGPYAYGGSQTKINVYKNLDPADKYSSSIEMTCWLAKHPLVTPANPVPPV